jgi:hypothetical protein
LMKSAHAVVPSAAYRKSGPANVVKPSCQDCQLSRGCTQRTPALCGICSLCGSPEATQRRAEVSQFCLVMNSLGSAGVPVKLLPWMHFMWLSLMSRMRSCPSQRGGKQGRREMTRMRRRKNSEPGLSVSWLRRHGKRDSVQSRTGPLRGNGPGIRIVTANVTRFSDRVQSERKYLW